MLGPKNKILDENFLKLVIDLITNYLSINNGNGNTQCILSNTTAQIDWTNGSTTHSVYADSSGVNTSLITDTSTSSNLPAIFCKAGYFESNPSLRTIVGSNGNDLKLTLSPRHVMINCSYTLGFCILKTELRNIINNNQTDFIAHFNTSDLYLFKPSLSYLQRKDLFPA